MITILIMKKTRTSRSYNICHQHAVQPDHINCTIYPPLQDYEKCRQHSLVSAGGAALLLILIPAFLATISTAYCTNLMDMFLYTSLDLFLLVTYVISLISVPAIIICCSTIGGYIIYYYGVFAGAVRNASRIGKADNRYILYYLTLL